MKITKIILCFADMDRIIVEPGHGKDGIIPIETQIKKFNLSDVTGYDVHLSLSPAEFSALPCLSQHIFIRTASNVEVNSSVTYEENEKP